MTKLIIENAILPAFRRGDFAGGIKAGVHDIRDVLLGDAEAVKERARAAKKRDGRRQRISPLLILLPCSSSSSFAWCDAGAPDRHPSRPRRSRRCRARRGVSHRGHPGRLGRRLGRRWGGGAAAAAAASRAAAAISAAAARRAAGRTRSERRKVRMTLVARGPQAGRRRDHRGRAPAPRARSWP